MEKFDMYNIINSLMMHLDNNNEKQCISLLEKYPFLLTQSLNSDGSTVFQLVVHYENFAIIDYLVYEKQIDIHQVDNDSENAIFYALGKNPKIMTKLYDLGVSLNEINVIGNTPLIVSAQNGLSASLEFLIEHGANINYESNKGTSLLSILEISRYPINFSFLMKHFDKFNEKNQKKLKKLRLKHLVERGITHEGNTSC